jgi:hypothetical protein
MQTTTVVATSPERRANALLGGAGFGALCVGVKAVGPALATAAPVPVAAVGAGVATGLLALLAARLLRATSFGWYALVLGAGSAALFATLRLL